MLCLVDSQAYAALEEIRGRMPRVQLAFYVNMKTIEAVHRALDIPLNKSTDNRFDRSQGVDDDEVEEDFVEEEVIDEVYPVDSV